MRAAANSLQSSTDLTGLFTQGVALGWSLQTPSALANQVCCGQIQPPATAGGSDLGVSLIGARSLRASSSRQNCVTTSRNLSGCSTGGKWAQSRNTISLAPALASRSRT